MVNWPKRQGRDWQHWCVRSAPNGDKDGSPRRLWVEVEWPRGPIGVFGGPPVRFVGVTGRDAAHCWQLVDERVGVERRARRRAAVWDIDISTTDRVPTGNPAALGVWYAGP